MKERPILFQGPMVRAILPPGVKTQTRRAMRPQPPQHTVAVGNWQDPPGYDPAWWAFTREGPVEHDHPFGGASIHGEPWRCPYGKPGDQLWVREGYSGPYSLTGKPPRDWPTDAPVWRWADGHPEYGDWTKPKPGMHMPRWASRVQLEVLDVRVERLQEISEEDAIAEGVERVATGKYRDYLNMDFPLFFDTAKESYRSLWGSINDTDGPTSWDANPWVWAVEFRRITP